MSLSSRINASNTEVDGGDRIGFHRPTAGAQLIFLHIPKAAGSTFNSIARMQYRKDHIKDFAANKIVTEIREFGEMTTEKRDSFRIFLGHVPFGLHRHLGAEAGYASVVRDPVERLISDYNYILRTPSHSAYRRFHSESTTIEQFVDERLHSGIINLQTLWISGAISPETADLRERAWNETDAELLDRAKRNIDERFFAIAPIEEFDAFVLVLAQLFRWRFAAFAVQNRAARREPALDPTLRRRIEEASYADRALYDYVSERFARQKAELGISARDIRNLHRRNAVFTRLNRLRTGLFRQ